MRPEPSHPRFAVTLLLVVLLWACAAAQTRHPYNGAPTDIPVALGVGTVRTPEIAVKNDLYYIMLQAASRLPEDKMFCMMGLFSGALQRADFHCKDDDPLLRADWTVSDANQVVAHGSSPLEGHSKYNAYTKIKIMGQFMGHAGRRYVVEVKFTKDATALAQANPHLIVILAKYH